MTKMFSSLDNLPHRVSVLGSAGDQVVASYGDLQAEYRFASVTKLFTAYATLIAVQRHLVDLEAPAGPPGATVLDLLAHTSGLPFEGSEAISAPRSTRIYSNTGMELLADHVAEHVGTTFEEWLETVVLEPLGLASIFLQGSPAHGAQGNVSDLATFAQELTAPTLVNDDLWQQARRPVLGGLRGVLPGYGRQRDNAWGLGFEIKADKTPHWTGSLNSPETFGHFGQSGSFLWVDPTANKSLVFLSERNFADWALEAWPPVADEFLRETS